MADKLRYSSTQYFKNNLGAFIGLGVFFCLLAIVCSAFEFLVLGLGAVFLIGFAIPCLFGITIQCTMFDVDSQVKFGTLLNYSTSYYKPHYFGSFRLLVCFLKALIVETIASTIVGAICYVAFKNLYASDFDECVQTLINFVYNTTNDVNALEDILEMNGGVFGRYIEVVNSISYLFGAFTFIFGVSFNSLACNFRSLLRNRNIAFGKNAVNQTIKNNRRAMSKDYFRMNWPLLVLLLLGLSAGPFISYYGFNTFEYSLAFGLIGGFLLMMIYFPKYLANMTIIFAKYQMTVITGIGDAIKNTIQKIQASVDLSPEDKKIIEETLKKLEEDKNAFEDDEKKDPDSES